MVKHIVMWNIKAELNKEEVIPTLKAKIEALPGKIDELINAEIGVDFTKNETGRDVVLYTEFASQEDYKSYLVHPAHVAVIPYVREVVSDRVDVDYEI